MKVKIREGKRLEHEGKEYVGGDTVDVGEDADRVKWLQEQETADPVDAEPEDERKPAAAGAKKTIVGNAAGGDPE